MNMQTIDISFFLGGLTVLLFLFLVYLMAIGSPNFARCDK